MSALNGEWNEDRLREFVRFWAEHGAKAIHWIEMGDRSMGKWEKGGSADLKGTAPAFIEEVPNPLAVLCEEASA